ncbi:MAG TPA: YCF48-related protein [Gemmatimonadales bacterium]|jgi:photosystem II stability/assembly factor-like uncharacterized protein|nr:YCF48-related protein [Gemmatimonadales bacterium]
MRSGGWTGLALLTTMQAVGAQTPRVTDQQSGTNALLQAVSPVSDRIVWISGHSGAVLRTLDGGTTWQIRPVPGAERLEFRAIVAHSANEAWIMSAGNGGQSRIYHTTDGGANWALQFTNPDSAAFYDCFTFFDAKRGVAFSDATAGRTMVLRTEDGGAHWALLPSVAVPAALPQEGAFSASGGCVTSIDNRHGWIATGNPEARIMRTDDAGKTWHAFPTPIFHSASAGLTGTAFRDANHGMAVGGGSIGGRSSGPDTTSAVVAITADGGRTWTLEHRPPPGAIYGVAVVPKAGSGTYVASSLTGLMVTRDNGNSWNAVVAHQYWSVGAAGRTAWGAGPGGRITRLDW